MPEVAEVGDTEQAAAGMTAAHPDNKEIAQGIGELAQGESRQPARDHRLLRVAAPSIRSGAGVKTTGVRGDSHRSLRSEQSTMSGARAHDSSGVPNKPLRAHQDVQKFLVGIHKSAEMEAQLQVQLLKQQEQSQMLSDSYRRRPLAHFRQVSEFEKNSAAYPSLEGVAGLEVAA